MSAWGQPVGSSRAASEGKLEQPSAALGSLLAQKQHLGSLGDHRFGWPWHSFGPVTALNSLEQPGSSLEQPWSSLEQRQNLCSVKQPGCSLEQPGAAWSSLEQLGAAWSSPGAALDIQPFAVWTSPGLPGPAWTSLEQPRNGSWAALASQTASQSVPVNPLSPISKPYPKIVP